jgi:hypothetical protein
MTPKKESEVNTGNGLSAGLVGSLTVMFGLDMWSHPHPNSGIDLLHIFPKADLARRAAIADLGGVAPTVAEHLGNYGYAASYMIPVMVLGHAVKEFGIRRKNETLKTVGDLIPLLGPLSLAAITLYVESITPNNHQFSGDLVATALGALHGGIATHVALGPFRRPRRKRDIAPQPTTIVN